MMKASQKVGDDTPISETTRATWSIQVSRQTAAMMPSGMPTASVIRKATVASSTVAGAYWAMSSITGRCEAMEMPRSPCTTPFRKIR
ncbi:MAG: hypothetical protein QM722_00110 [Piscinibacter sp.]